MRMVSDANGTEIGDNTFNFRNNVVPVYKNPEQKEENSA